MGAYLALQLFGAGVNMVDLSRKDHWSIKQWMINRGGALFEKDLVGSSGTACADRKLEQLENKPGFLTIHISQTSLNTAL